MGKFKLLGGNVYIQVSAHLTILEIEPFRKAAAECSRLVVQNEPRTNIYYEWFLSGDQCEVREEYMDSSAFLEHLRNVEKPLQELLQHSELNSVVLYGEPPKELMAALEGMPVKVYSPL